MFVNLTVQSFPSENEMELNIMRWDAVKDKYMSRFAELGLERYTCTRVWNKVEKFQLAYVFEYKDEQAMKNCLPLWKEIEKEFQEKITNMTVAYRGIVIDQYDFT